MRKKIIFLFPLFLVADVNPFNAGVNSGYGLTPDERAILNNKKNITDLQNECNTFQKRLNAVELKLINYDETIKDKLNAFPTFVDELNNAMNDIVILKRKIKTLSDELNQTKTQNEKELKDIKNDIKLLKKNIEILKATLNSVIDTQNHNYEELRKLLKKLIEKKTLSPKKAFYKAKQLFFNNKLDKARELFLYSLSKKFLPATSAYYLGEISFRKGNYKEALSYYKKSINLYSKPTSFTPKLLYHTGISFLRIGNKEASKLTFKKLIHDFPNSKYTHLARKELEKFE